MTKKFTEEQYQEIINFEDFETVYRLGLVDSFVGEIIPFISNNDLQQEAMAISNPLTRKWAHDKFVEKDKKYMWKLKSKHEIYLCYLLGSRSIIPSNINFAFLTESEVKEWGYNPEMFDKEEV
jgi:hypothetical protein